MTDTVRQTEYLSIQEAAKKLNIHPDTLRRRIRAGDLPATRVGPRLLRIKITDLELFVRQIQTRVGK